MTNSIIFYTRAGNVKDSFMHYDCCEHLGSNLNDNGVKYMYIAIPNKEMHSFFKNPAMLEAYMDFITKAFDIQFSVATEEEISSINFANSKTKAGDCVVLKHTRDKNMSNKYFNSAYNVLRYLWYRHYTNMAMIATNLHLLNIFDAFDTLALAHSYQTQNSRALLPMQTVQNQGMLFFRPKAEVIKDLCSNNQFNAVFYKYPVYFNPIVEVSGSFFSDAKNTIAAKETIERLGDVEAITELPGFIRNNVRVIAADYLLMKDVYLELIKVIAKSGYQMSFNNPLLLSKNMDSIPVQFANAMGSTYTKYLSVSEEGKFSIEDVKPRTEPKKRAKKEVVEEVTPIPILEDVDWVEDEDEE